MASDALAQSNPRFRVTDLGNLGYLPRSVLPQDPEEQGTFGINSNGEVVFGMMVDDEIHAMLWLPEPAYDLAAGLHDLADLFDPGAFDQPSIARDINDDGIAVGQTGSTTTSAGSGIVWDIANRELWIVPDDGLGDPCDPAWSNAHAINNDDPPIVTGEAGHYFEADPCEDFEDDACLPCAYRFTLPAAGVDPSPQELAPRDDQADCDQVSYGRDVNRAGAAFRVGGGSSGFWPDIIIPPTDLDAVVWPNLSTLTVLPRTVEGETEPFAGLESMALGVNDAGEVVGWVQRVISPHARQPAYWPDGETLVRLEVLPNEGNYDNAASAINNAAIRQIVGFNQSLNKALLWEDDGGWAVVDISIPPVIQECVDLEDIRQAHDINDDGWIITWGRVDVAGPDENHAFLLTPIGDCP
jgi:hypothetical protein